LKNRGTLLAEKDETKGDLIFNEIRLEIGGANKNPKLADFVIRDDIDLPVRNAIPCGCLGWDGREPFVVFVFRGYTKTLQNQITCLQKNISKSPGLTSGFIRLPQKSRL
jgi:hypothetical protein